MTPPNAKTVKKREIQLLRDEVKQIRDSDNLNKVVIAALLGSEAIYSRLPTMKRDKLPGAHIELAKTKEGAVIMFDTGIIYHVPVGDNEWYHKLYRKAKKKVEAGLTKIKAWTSKPKTELEASQENSL